MADDDHEEVGYGRPPFRTQFKKGQSGNPSGRPKSSFSFGRELADELSVSQAINENGEIISVSKQRAFIKSLTAAAIDRDMRAAAALLACIKHFGVGVEEPPEEDTDIEDLDALQTYIDNRRKEQSHKT